MKLLSKPVLEDAEEAVNELLHLVRTHVDSAREAKYYQELIWELRQELRRRPGLTIGVQASTNLEPTLYLNKDDKLTVYLVETEEDQKEMKRLNLHEHDIWSQH